MISPLDNLRSSRRSSRYSRPRARAAVTVGAAPNACSNASSPSSTQMVVWKDERADAAVDAGFDFTIEEPRPHGRDRSPSARALHRDRFGGHIREVAVANPTGSALIAATVGRSCKMRPSHAIATGEQHMRIAARIAGFTLLFYIVVGISAMGGVFHGSARELATIAQNASAVVLAVTLYVVTRREGQGVAALGMTFRLGEGLLGTFVSIAGITLAQRNLVAATLFAIGSTFFCWLLLRGRMLPDVLASLGLVASLVLVVGLPLQIAGILRGTIPQVMWLPMLAFEVPAGFWLLIKGVPHVSERSRTSITASG